MPTLLEVKFVLFAGELRNITIELCRLLLLIWRWKCNELGTYRKHDEDQRDQGSVER